VPATVSGNYLCILSKNTPIVKPFYIQKHLSHHEFLLDCHYKYKYIVEKYYLE